MLLYREMMVKRMLRGFNVVQSGRCLVVSLHGRF